MCLCCSLHRTNTHIEQDKTKYCSDLFMAMLLLQLSINLLSLELGNIDIVYIKICPCIPLIAASTRTWIFRVLPATWKALEKTCKNVVFSVVALTDSLWLQQRKMYSVKFAHCSFAYVQIPCLLHLKMRKNLSSVGLIFFYFFFNSMMGALVRDVT